MIRYLLRLLAMIALAVAVILAVVDATRSVAESQLVMTPLAQSWSELSPNSIAAFRAWVEAKLHPAVWDPVLAAVVALPGFAVFGLIALLLYALGRRPQRRPRRLTARI